jgi:hypothetical protein
MAMGVAGLPAGAMFIANIRHGREHHADNE